jgi:hypothetical protein
MRKTIGYEIWRYCPLKKANVRYLKCKKLQHFQLKIECATKALLKKTSGTICVDFVIKEVWTADFHLGTVLKPLRHLD